MPTGSTLRRVDGAAGVLSRWPWLSGQWHAPGVRLGCIQLHATSPAPCRASSIWLCLVWAWAALCAGCMACACACLQAGCLRPCAGKRRGGGFFRAGLPSVARRQAPRDRGGRPSFRKTAGERGIDRAGRTIPRKKTGTPYTKQPLRTLLLLRYLSGNAWGQSVGKVWNGFDGGAGCRAVPPATTAETGRRWPGR